MRAKSAKQRFPVIEWIRKLDKLQVTAIRMCERSKKRPTTPTKGGFRNSLQKFATSNRSSRGSKNLGMSSPNTSIPALPLVEPLNHGSAANSSRGSYDTSASGVNQGLLTPANDGTRSSIHHPPRNISETSLADLADDNSSLEPPELQRGVIGPPPKGSSLSRKLSLGTRLGPGHVRLRKHESIATIDSIGPIDEEQHYTMPDEDDDDEYMYSVAAIRRQMAKNQGSQRGIYTDPIELSDQESDYHTPDSGSVYEYDPERAPTNKLEPSDFEEDQGRANNYFSNIQRGPAHVGLGVYAAQDDIESDAIESRPESPRRTDYGILTPLAAPRVPRPEASHLSLASVLSGREDFALSKVEDMFTDADGKYLKQFTSELQKIDAKASKDELCIEEFITKREKEWSNEVRNKKLGLDSFAVEKGHISHKVPTAPSQVSEDQLESGASHPESQFDEPLVSFKRPTGIKLFLQRRIGDWPLYSFFIALV